MTSSCANGGLCTGCYQNGDRKLQVSEHRLPTVLRFLDVSSEFFKKTLGGNLTPGWQQFIAPIAGMEQGDISQFASDGCNRMHTAAGIASLNQNPQIVALPGGLRL